MDGSTVTAIDNEALVGFVDEIEHQLDERKIVTETLGGIYERAKRAGFVPAFLRQMVKERHMAVEERETRLRTLDEYRRALGLLADTPLGEAAMKGAEVIEPEWPKPFAEQTMHRGRGRPRKPMLFDAEHPQGTA